MTRSTQLVVEGFPRSGNSFTELALRACQPSLVHLAHHSHSAAQVNQAVKWGIPTLIVIRNPIDAIASFAAHRGSAHIVRSLLSDYLHFHISILESLPGVAIVTFDELTRDFNVVVESMNSRFDLGLQPVDDLVGLRRDVLELMNERSRARRRGEIGGANPDRPRGAETPIKETARATLSSDGTLSRRLAHATVLYRGLADGTCGPDPGTGATP